MVERARQGNTGFTSLWRGTPTIGTTRVMDYGYVHEDATSRAIRRRTGNPDILEWCRQVRLHRDINTLALIIRPLEYQLSSVRPSAKITGHIAVSLSLPIAGHVRPCLILLGSPRRGSCRTCSAGDRWSLQQTGPLVPCRPEAAC